MRENGDIPVGLLTGADIYHRAITCYNKRIKL